MNSMIKHHYKHYFCYKKWCLFLLDRIYFMEVELELLVDVKILLNSLKEFVVKDCQFDIEIEVEEEVADIDKQVVVLVIVVAVVAVVVYIAAVDRLFEVIVI